MARLFRLNRNVLFVLYSFVFFTSFTVEAASIQPPRPTENGLLQFQSHYSFRQAFPAILLEDFEESPIADGTFSPCSGPLHSMTNQPPNCFLTGEIEPGIIIDSSPSHSLAVTGAGYNTLTTYSVSLATTPSEEIMVLDFPEGGVNAVGMDLASLSSGTTYTVNIYNTGLQLLESITTYGVSTSGSFYGWYSATPIGRITLDNGSFEIVDDIGYGQVAFTVSYYTDRAEFLSKNTNLVFEDFEESPIADNSIMFISQPLDETTDIAGGFSPGDIQHGLSVSTLAEFGDETLVIVGEHYLPYDTPSVQIATRNRSEELKVSFFYGLAYAAGMDLMVSEADEVTVIVYGPHDSIVGVTTLSLTDIPSFFGVFSRETIARVCVINADRLEFVDNIHFGGKPEHLTFFTDRHTFTTENKPLKKIDFSAVPVPPWPGTELICDEPINSTTDNACVAPGDIAEGISLGALKDTLCPDCMYFAGTGYLCEGGPKTLRNPNDVTEITFTEPVTYAGISTPHITPIYAYVYGPENELMGVDFLLEGHCSGTFWGVVSDRPISRIELGREYTNVLLSEIYFGNRFPWAMFLPAVSGATGGE